MMAKTGSISSLRGIPLQKTIMPNSTLKQILFTLEQKSWIGILKLLTSYYLVYDYGI